MTLLEIFNRFYAQGGAKLQQKVSGRSAKTAFSQRWNIETTRRNSQKNQNRNQTGHIAYGVDEFDGCIFVEVPIKGLTSDLDLFGERRLYDLRTNVNLWNFSLVHVDDMIDPDNPGLVKGASSDVLRRNRIDTSDINLNAVMKESFPDVYSFINHPFVYTQTKKEWGKMISGASEAVAAALLNECSPKLHFSVRDQEGNAEGWDIRVKPI